MLLGFECVVFLSMGGRWTFVNFVYKTVPVLFFCRFWHTTTEIVGGEVKNQEKKWPPRFSTRSSSTSYVRDKIVLRNTPLSPPSLDSSSFFHHFFFLNVTGFTACFLMKDTKSDTSRSPPSNRMGLECLPAGLK